jgi:opacity protein-like surface antigen
MKKKLGLALFIGWISISNALAEDYLGFAVGYSFSQKLSSLHGNENLNYPDAPIGINQDDSSLFPGTHYSEVSLKDVLSAGLKAGHYFDSNPNLGVELEMNYSQPNILRQNVTLSNPNFYSAIGTPWFTEDQLPAKVQLFQFNLNALYRFKSFNNLTPYVGAGPSLNILRITGTGFSGIIVAPAPMDGGPGPAIHQTSVNWGLNFKAGAEYQLDEHWGLSAEYHFNWVPIEVDNFRSVSNLKADYTAHNISAVLVRHF